jgi:hypothetical protein
MNQGNSGKYVVVRETYANPSAPSKWRPLTRPLEKDSAEQWLSFELSQELKKRRSRRGKVFLVQV